MSPNSAVVLGIRVTGKLLLLKEKWSKSHFLYLSQGRAFPHSTALPAVPQDSQSPDCAAINAQSTDLTQAKLNPSCFAPGTIHVFERTFQKLFFPRSSLPISPSGCCLNWCFVVLPGVTLVPGVFLDGGAGSEEMVHFFFHLFFWSVFGES